MEQYLTYLQNLPLYFYCEQPSCQWASDYLRKSATTGQEKLAILRQIISAVLEQQGAWAVYPRSQLDDYFFKEYQVRLLKVQNW